ncbi:3-phosphoshikimate 1-carboxyvinyltransferase [Heyndrickxia acidicola]|uniref:3-phosphoshikimate 1-carboxyvinyltransferase n=1 Tax=Heyndrickxia acidicola TaxID=209389 RepID=A0ABU6MJY5_9BACI|nr:3-phosphoshikimate 1-carboxyvinyltransferase [Heyndrickxia acidicola]MED1205001.1 3-phosphoshikimate 1-carboxyvinyltransferase [Heyndrickxia acidicola]
MNTIQLDAKQPSIRGRLRVPGDKSISHRAIMFGAIGNGKTVIRNFLKGADCLSTISCFKKLGVEIEEKKEEIIVNGKGWDGLKEPASILDVGNSGTTTRLLLGVLAGRPFHSILIGDSSIAKRPMSRVADPLRNMGAIIDGRENGQYTPLSIRGGKLQAIDFTMKVASAQVKSALLFAGLQTDGITTIMEPVPTRDHTERMIRQFEGEVDRNESAILLRGRQNLSNASVDVPGDISSAAFFMVAAAITPNSEVTIESVGLNPTRTGIIEVLERMGAYIQVEPDNTGESEQKGSIVVKSSDLKGIEISGSLIPRLIDELPIIALLATQASGTTIIKDAAELKVKETNRIDAVVNELTSLGADIEATEDGMIIHGKSTILGGKVKSYGDHRMGMMLVIASLISSDTIYLEGPEAIKVSYPEFFQDLETLTK